VGEIQRETERGRERQKETERDRRRKYREREREKNGFLVHSLQEGITSDTSYYRVAKTHRMP